MARSTDAQRHQAIGMFAAGMSKRQIARRYGCSHQTVSNFSNRYHLTGTVADKGRSGRPRVTTVIQGCQIRLTHLRRRFTSAVQTARQTVSIHRRRISASTVRRHLSERNLRAYRAYRGNVLTSERRRNRVTWCGRYSRLSSRDWRGVDVTGESRCCIDMHDGRQQVWRRPGDRYADCCVRQALCSGGGIVMVCGGISWSHKTRLVVEEGTLTARRYIDLILQNHADVTHFQQDNARPHTARLASTFLHDHNINVFYHCRHFA